MGHKGLINDCFIVLIPCSLVVNTLERLKKKNLNDITSLISVVIPVCNKTFSSPYQGEHLTR